jgi:hypothetical protein
MSQAGYPRLRFVLDPFLSFMSVSVLAGGAGCRPVCPGGAGFHLAGLRLLP